MSIFTSALPAVAISTKLGCLYRRWSFAPGLGVLAALIASGPVTHSAAAAEVTGPAVPGLETFDERIPALLKKWQAPGGAFVVAYDGRIVFARGYGLADRDTGRPVRPDTRFRVASVSKSLTAAVVLKLIEEGRLSFDSHPFALLDYPAPAYRGAQLDPRLKDITVRQLLNHTGGWNPSTANNPIVGGRGFDPQQYQREIAQRMGTSPPASAETVIRYMLGQPLQADPGTAYAYSPLGFSVLGRVIERVTGESYEAATQELLRESYISEAAIGGSRQTELSADEAVYYDYPGAPLVPSHLDPGTVAQPYQWSLRSWDAQGGWSMSALDCVRFLIALDGLNGMPRLLRAETFTTMRTAQYPSASYGYGWEIYPSQLGPAGGHGGSMPGTSAQANRSADGRIHWALLVNSRPQTVWTPNEVRELVESMRPALAAVDNDLTWTTLGWEAWRRRYFGAPGCAPLEDNDGDGVTNLMEYAAGLNPTAADDDPPVVLQRSASGASVAVYRRIVLEHPLVWELESRQEGAGWQAVTAAPSSQQLNPDGAWKIAIPVGQATSVRLRVTHRDTALSTTFEAGRAGTPVIRLQPASATMGSQARLTLSVLAGGARTFQWYKDGAPISGATGPALTLGPTTISDTGDYTVAVTNESGTTTSAIAHVTVSSEPHARPESMLVNLSSRGFVGTGDDAMIAGFVVAGPGSKRLLLRAIGPSLAPYGLSGVLPHASLTLTTLSGAVLATNTAWEPGDASAFSEAQAFPLSPGSLDAALVVALPPGAYTAVVRGVGNETGIALVELYDLERAAASRLVNLSTRARVGPGAETLIGGFIVDGPGERHLVVRAAGPALASFGVAGVLPDPSLRLVQEDGTVLAKNNDWADTTAAPLADAFSRVGAFPFEPTGKDAALLANLLPGAYTTLVSDASDRRGVGLVEVFELP